MAMFETLTRKQAGKMAFPVRSDWSWQQKPVITCYKTVLFTPELLWNYFVIGTWFEHL
jgi:hypothetical protein